jgi:3-deoxy-manno-octulosonate cytidylyltransferase (CMP-KDO synthetase)
LRNVSACVFSSSALGSRTTGRAAEFVEDGDGVVAFGTTASHVAITPPPANHNVFNVAFVIMSGVILAPGPTGGKPVLLFDVRPADCSDSIRDRPQTHKHTVAVIPARYASTRIPGKALADIGGRPMIEHVYRRAAAARNVDAVIVATDDARIVEAVKGFGGDVRMTSPTHQTGTDRLAEVAAGLDCDLVVNVQGDEPLIEPESIDEAIEPFRADPALSMSTICNRIRNLEEANDPNVCKVVIDRRGFALYFSRAPVPFRRGPQGEDAGPYKHIGLYVYRREFLLQLASLEPTPLERSESLEQLRVLEHGFSIKIVQTRHDSIGVDTPEDLERVRRLLTVETRA